MKVRKGWKFQGTAQYLEIRFALRTVWLHEGARPQRQPPTSCRRRPCGLLVWQHTIIPEWQLFSAYCDAANLIFASGWMDSWSRWMDNGIQPFFLWIKARKMTINWPCSSDVAWKPYQGEMDVFTWWNRRRLDPICPFLLIRPSQTKLSREFCTAPRKMSLSTARSRAGPRRPVPWRCRREVSRLGASAVPNSCQTHSTSRNMFLLSTFSSHFSERWCYCGRLGNYVKSNMSVYSYYKNVRTGSTY